LLSLLGLKEVAYKDQFVHLNVSEHLSGECSVRSVPQCVSLPLGTVFLSRCLQK